MPSRNRCFYIGCDNTKTSKPDLTFHRYPLDKERLFVWIQRSGHKVTSGEDYKKYPNRSICSAHFNKEDYVVSRRPVLRSTAVPKDFHLSKANNGSAKNEIWIKEERIEHLSDDYNSQESEFTMVAWKWNNKCITCLKEDVQIETVNSLNLLSEFKELFKYLRIEEFQNEITQNMVCSNCVLQMHNILSFKRQCEESTKKLGLFTKASISKTIKSSTVFEKKLHKSTQTESEEQINLNSLVETFLDVKEEPNEIECTEIKQELNLIALDKKCVTCVNCNEKFDNDSWLRRHQILIHGLKNCIQECYHCLKLHFKDYENKLRIHNERNHENICSVCDLKFQTIIHLAKHRLLHTVSDNNISKSRRPRGKVTCAICRKYYQSVKLLRRHMRTIHNLNKVKIACKMCTQSVYNMNEHLKWHHANKFHRPRQQRIAVPQQKKKSRLIDTKKDLCTYCGKLFNRKNIKLHILTVHLNIKNVKCMYCDKMFASVYKRNMHINRVHLNLKRFSCEYCEQKFSTKGHAKTHMLKHTKEKPFKCQCCNKLFRYRENLRRHMKKVHEVI